MTVRTSRRSRTARAAAAATLLAVGIGVVTVDAGRSAGPPAAASRGALPAERSAATPSEPTTTAPSPPPLPAVRASASAAAPAGPVPPERRSTLVAETVAAAAVLQPARRADAAATPLAGTSVAQAVRRTGVVLTRSPGVPVRLAYPRLGIRAPVQPEPEVGGVLRIPADVRRVGWDSATPRPGASGTALLAGHVDSKRAGDGALAPLRGARPGDLLTLVLTNRQQQRWRVVAVRQVRKTGLPSDLLTLNGRPRLVLVTCGGPFDRRTGHYRDNLIVYAVQA